MGGRAHRRFQHLLAFGNSDQESFRNKQVRASFDIMTVPGTIASYYDEATAAFVLSSQIPYMIDPRTPLFQDELRAPRASHYSLAAWHGQSVLDHLSRDEAAAYFPPTFWGAHTIDEMVREVVSRQRDYAGNAPRVTKKLDRYARLLAAAMEEQDLQLPRKAPSAPEAVLAPYFAVTGLDDPWWNVVADVWASCTTLDDARSISPVLCVGGRQEREGPQVTSVPGVAVLEELLPYLPPALARTCYIWITGFDERVASLDALRQLWRVTHEFGKQRRLVNLYGGFFSICLRYAGLSGFGNGLTYSESRAWPALASTGSAPPRYYMRDLHAFLPPAAAAAVVGAEPAFSCDCEACRALAESGATIASMPYHALKLHFALARAWELGLVADHRPGEVAGMLLDAKGRLDRVRDHLPPGVSPQGEHLSRWAAVLNGP